jgi:hypothetical protein
MAGLAARRAAQALEEDGSCEGCRRVACACLSGRWVSVEGEARPWHLVDEVAPYGAASGAGSLGRSATGAGCGSPSAGETYAQFVKDVPRACVALDGVEWRENATLLFMTLWPMFRSRHEALRGLALFVQSELAPWFLLGRSKFVRGPEQHLLDGGRQSIDVDMSSAAGGKKRVVRMITLRKPFRIVDFSPAGDSSSERFRVLLTVQYDLDKDQLMHAWERQVDGTVPPAFAGADSSAAVAATDLATCWEYVDSCAGPEPVRP